MLRFVLVASLSAVVVGGCGPTPNQLPTGPSPGRSPTALTVVPCERDRDEGNPAIGGWIDGQLAATFRHGPCLYDMARTRWVAVGPRTGGRFVTDGSTLAGSARPGTLTILTPGENTRDVELPPWASAWTFWGGRLSAMPGAGYVFDLLPELAILSGDGRLTEAPIPAGFLVVGPTSDPSVFVLRRDDRVSAPEAMNGPFPAASWTVGDLQPTWLPMIVDSIATASRPDLIWLRDARGGWWLIDHHGPPRIGYRATAPWDGTPDPSGRYAVEQTDRSEGCDHVTPPRCVTRLIDRATNHVIAHANAGSNSEWFWADGSVAFTPTTSDPVSHPAAEEIIVLSASGASQIPLP